MCRLCAHPDLWAEFAALGASQKASVREERAQVVYLTVTLETSPVLLCGPPPPPFPLVQLKPAFFLPSFVPLT